MATKEPQTPEAKIAREWIAELDACEKWSRNYRDRCKRILRRYRNDNATAEGQPDFSQRRFAILWSNTQILGPAIYARTPNAIVGRRYKDSDPIGRWASEVLERALNYNIDCYDFDALLRNCRDSYLLVGRAQAWLRYVPHEDAQGDITEDTQITSNADEGEGELDTEDGPPEGQEEQLDEYSAYSQTVVDYLNNDDWGYTPCREWEEVSYVWRRAFLDRNELIERFGRKIGGQIPLDWKPKDDPQDQNSSRTKTKKAAIYEIWDKTTRMVYWVSKSWNEGVLDSKPDWLQLERFFPCPRPMMATVPSDQFLPIPDFVYYQDQAEEIDDLTSRIATLSDALRMVGIYAGEVNDDLQNMFSSTNNTLIPVKSMASLADKGGLKGLVEWFPVNTVIETLKGCIETRKQLLDDVYQITGISDIVRGTSDPAETATAQGIKEQWGSLRVRDKQREVARFARDLLKLQGEVIAKKYQAPMLATMTDVKLPTRQQQQAVQMAMQQNAQIQQQPPQPGMPPKQPIPIPPQLQEIAQRPAWEDVEGLLNNGPVMGFRIDIETDATVEPNEQLEKQKRVEFVTAMSTFIGACGQVIPIMPQVTPLAGEALKYLARGFQAGREMEDAIESFVDQVTKQPPPNPAQQGDNGAQQMMAQLKQAEMQQKAQATQQQMQLEAAKLQQSAQQTQQDNAVKVHEINTDAQLRQQEVQSENLRTMADAHVQQQQAQAQAMQPRVMPFKRGR